MTDTELDTFYSSLCSTMSQLGEAQAPLFLARLSLLAVSELADSQQAMHLIDAAAEGLVASTAR